VVVVYLLSLVILGLMTTQLNKRRYININIITLIIIIIIVFYPRYSVPEGA